MEKTARTRLLTAAVLVVVFGAGIVLGMAVIPREPTTTATADSAATASRQGADSAGRRHRPPLYMQVDPTPEQKVKLDSLLQENREAMRALTREFHAQYDAPADSLRAELDSLREKFGRKYQPRYDSLIAGTRAAMRAVLTPEQAEKWDSLIARADSARARADSARAEDRRRGERGSRDRD